MFSLNFMFFCSLIEELCTEEENYKTSCSFNFGHECSNQDFLIHLQLHFGNQLRTSFPLIFLLVNLLLFLKKKYFFNTNAEYRFGKTDAYNTNKIK